MTKVCKGSRLWDEETRGCDSTFFRLNSFKHDNMNCINCPFNVEKEVKAK